MTRFDLGGAVEAWKKAAESMDENGMLPPHNCHRCGKPLNADGNRPAELYLGTYTGLCTACMNASPYEVKRLISGAKLMSHPPHLPSWRRSREEFIWFEDCPDKCIKGVVPGTWGGWSNYPKQCPTCLARHENHPEVRRYKEDQKKLRAVQYYWRSRMIAEYERRLKKAGYEGGEIEEGSSPEECPILSGVLRDGPPPPEKPELPVFPAGWAKASEVALTMLIEAGLVPPGRFNFRKGK